MIYIVIALFIITLLLRRKTGRRKISRKETAYLFVILLCAGLVVRTVLFIFGM
jgi:hypothetical protein